LYYFLTDRSTAAEYRALLASFGGTPVLRMGPGEDALFGDGWSGAEAEGGRYARWVIGKRALIAMPGTTGPLTFEMSPAITPQSVTIYINDKSIQTVSLASGRNRYSVPAEWRDGINIVRFEFDRTSGDSRPIAARVFAVGIGGFDGPDRQHDVRIENLVQPR
jgi:hypothetical protein